MFASSSLLLLFMQKGGSRQWPQAQSARREYLSRLPPSSIPPATCNRLKLYGKIGLNNSANEVQKRTGAIHELGHSLIDYRSAASGYRFEDFKFFSLSNAPSESNANLAGADLCISDEFILERIHYGQYQEVVEHINQHISQYKTDSAKMAFEEEQIRDFYESYTDIPSYDQLAMELGVDVGVVKFKFRALRYKDYDLPNLPETRADFLKNWQRSTCW